MKHVTFTRDMRPFQANHDYALPDAVADHMVAEGHARPADAGDGGMEPDATAPASIIAKAMQAVRPGPTPYMTRKGRKT